MRDSSRAYFSVLRWRKDPTRDEARNIAVVVVDVERESGLFEAVPLSMVSERLHEQGLLDQMLVGLEKQVVAKGGFTLESLRDLQGKLTGSLVLTEPKEAIIPDGNSDMVLEALKKAYLAQAGRGSNVLTKGRVLDNVVSSLRRYKQGVKRGAYVKDYIFDVVLESNDKADVLEVMSFASPSKDWVPTEHTAGYFLYALEQVGRDGIAVIQPPTSESDSTAVESHNRVIRLMKKDRIPVVRPEELAKKLNLDRQLKMAGT